MSNESSDGVELFTCVRSSKSAKFDQDNKPVPESGMCVVPPVIRKTPNTPHGAGRVSPMQHIF